MKSRIIKILHTCFTYVTVIFVVIFACLVVDMVSLFFIKPYFEQKQGIFRYVILAIDHIGRLSFGWIIGANFKRIYNFVWPHEQAN